jgi:hypothetical protein
VITGLRRRLQNDNTLRFARETECDVKRQRWGFLKQKLYLSTSWRLRRTVGNRGQRKCPREVGWGPTILHVFLCLLVVLLSVDGTNKFTLSDQSPNHTTSVSLSKLVQIFLVVPPPLGGPNPSQQPWQRHIASLSLNIGAWLRWAVNSTFQPPYPDERIPCLWNKRPDVTHNGSGHSGTARSVLSMEESSLNWCKLEYSGWLIA